MSLSPADSRGWSVLQALANNCNNTKAHDTENEKAYVHPLAKRRSSRLSEESLRMCTESLGSETGSTDAEGYQDEFAVLSAVSEYGAKEKGSKLLGFRGSKKMNSNPTFPPLLTSITGSSGVQVRPHREGGRLVLKVSTVPSSRGLFHADRSDGRLRLRMVHEEGIGEEGEEAVEEEAFETEAAEEVDEETSDDSFTDEDMEEHSGGFRDEIGREATLPAPSRCIVGERGSKTLTNWQPFWRVAYKLSV